MKYSIFCTNFYELSHKKFNIRIFCVIIGQKEVLVQLTAMSPIMILALALSLSVSFYSGSTIRAITLSLIAFAVFSYLFRIVTQSTGRLHPRIPDIFIQKKQKKSI